MTDTTTITAAIFGSIADHSRPALTFYDDATGGRTELSWATLGNWAAKTANLLVDEIGVAPGDDIVVDLPEHWQTAGILLGAWWAGAHVHLSDDAADDPRAVFTDRARIDRYPDADELIVAPLDPFALPIPGLPPGVGDYGSRVRIHGDHMAGPVHRGPALDDRDTETVLASAAAAARAAGITAGSRVLSTREWHTADGVIANFLAPLVVGAGLVWVAHPDDDQSTRIRTEHATVVLDGR
ncbi:MULTISPECIES: TIGR03089 family protein [unclassified Gordonia (in: high G+C Gram-positive bacteria)]